MLTFFGDLIARREAKIDIEGEPHEFTVRLFRTEAPGYVLAVRYLGDSADRHWAAHTPTRLEVAALFERHVCQVAPPPAALGLFREAMQAVMLQAPELDEMVQWSSVVANTP